MTHEDIVYDRRVRLIEHVARIGNVSDLEDLLARIRAAAKVSTRTDIVLSTYYENRPVTGG